MVDGCQSKLVNIVSRVLAMFWTSYFLSCTPPNLFFMLGIYFSVMLMSQFSPAVVTFPGASIRIAVAVYLNCDFSKVSGWCDLWGMKLNDMNAMMVSRSCTMLPQSPMLTSCDCAKESDDLDILGVTLIFR